MYERRCNEYCPAGEEKGNGIYCSVLDKFILRDWPCQITKDELDNFVIRRKHGQEEI